MRKFLAAALMLIIVAGHALALTASASAMVFPQGGQVVSGAVFDVAAVPVNKRVCWRKTMFPADGDADSGLAPPCGGDVKFSSDIRIVFQRPDRQVHAARELHRLFGGSRDGPFRPPIA
jgi:hypothetical protein